MHLGILGGGPIGLEMALAGVRSGARVTIFEQGPSLCSNVRSWGHVTLFSPNSLNMSTLGKQILTEMKAPVPEEEIYPTGFQYLESYLNYIGEHLEKNSQCKIYLNCKVIGVSRESLLKSDLSKRRKSCKFRILSEDLKTEEEFIIDNIDTVVDATGTYGNNNHTGIGGLPALGEKSLKSRGDIEYTIPNIGEDAVKYASGDKNNPKHTLVIGSGASAVTCLSMLQRLGVAVGGVAVTWITRREAGQSPYNIIQNDTLPQREALYKLGNMLAEATDKDMVEDGFAQFQYMCQSSITNYKRIDGRILVSVKNNSLGTTETLCVDNIIATVGYRPDTDITRELQIHYCYATEGPMKLAASLLGAGGGSGDCLAQQSAGDETLVSPEPGVFVIGMKSYGRGSAFLLRLGHQQVDAVCRLLNLTSSQKEYSNGS